MFCKEILVHGRIRPGPDYRGGVGAAGTSETSICINRCLGAPWPPAAVVSHMVRPLSPARLKRGNNEMKVTVHTLNPQMSVTTVL